MDEQRTIVIGGDSGAGPGGESGGSRALARVVAALWLLGAAAVAMAILALGLALALLLVPVVMILVLVAWAKLKLRAPDGRKNVRVRR